MFQKGGDVNPMAILAALGLKGNGKGQNRTFGKGGWSRTPENRWAEKLRQVDVDKKVWVGGLSHGTTWKQVEKHFEQVMKPQICDVAVRRDGTATATLAYASASDVATVVAALNGSELNGETIEVDVWQTGTWEKSDNKPKKGQGKSWKNAQTPTTTSGLMKVLSSKFAKTGSWNKGDNKYAEKLKTIDASLKVWVGGLSEKTTWKTLEKHFSSVAKPQIVDIMWKGQGVVAYKNADDVASAIESLNGMDLEGATLEVDVWTQKEKKKSSE